MITAGRSHIRVLIVEPLPLIIHGMLALLRRHSRLKVAAVRELERSGFQTESRVADIALVDVSGTKGWGWINDLKRSLPSLHIVAMDMEVRGAQLIRARREKLSGYVLKWDSINNLAKQLEVLGRHQFIVSESVRVRSANMDEAMLDQESGINLLTPRQLEILTLIGSGLTTSEIADRLKLSFSTVDNHKSKLMNKLNIHRLAGLVRLSIASGLVSIDKLEPSSIAPTFKQSRRD